MIKRRKQSSNRTLVLQAFNNSYNKSLEAIVDMDTIEESVGVLLYCIRSLVTYHGSRIEGLDELENVLTTFFEHWLWNGNLIPPTRTIDTEGLCANLKERLNHELKRFISMIRVIISGMSQQNEQWMAYQLLNTGIQTFLASNPIIQEVIKEIGGSSGHGSE